MPDLVQRLHVDLIGLASSAVADQPTPGWVHLPGPLRAVTIGAVSRWWLGTVQHAVGFNQRRTLGLEGLNLIENVVAVVIGHDQQPPEVALALRASICESRLDTAAAMSCCGAVLSLLHRRSVLARRT